MKLGDKMCESSVYSTEGSLIMEDVIYIKIDNAKIDLTDILNQKKELKGKIVEMDLEKHKIYVNLK
jgi:predicted RNA-binding protein